MFGLPEYFVFTIIFALGMIIGSFLDVFVCRFHTGKSMNGRSRCLSCGHQLLWFELFPLFSYLFLKGICRECGSRVPVRLFLMEVGVGSLFLFVYTQAITISLFVFGILLLSLLIVIALYDMRHMVIPNEFVVVALVLSVISIGFSTGWVWNAPLVFTHIASGLGAGLFYATLWFVSKGRWIGLGDAKLAVPLGIIVGFPEVFSLVVLSFWVGATISMCILVFPYTSWFIKKVGATGKENRRKQSRVPSGNVVKYQRYFTMKTEVPFAPFMIIAFILVYFSHFDVLRSMVFAF